MVALPLGILLGAGAAFGANALAERAQRSDMRAERERVAALVADQDEALGARAANFSENGPDLLVLEYLDLLAEGKAVDASELAPEYSGTALNLLTDEFYGAVPSRVALPRISEVTMKSEHRAEVTAAFELGTSGITQEWTFDVSRSGDAWRLESVPLTEVPITMDRAGKVTVNGADVTSAVSKDGARWAGSVMLAPGVYEIKYADPGKFWSATPAKVTVPASDGSASADFTTTISPAVIQSATKQAQAKSNQWMDQCVSSRFTGPACSKDAREEGSYIVGKAVIRLYVGEYPKISLTWNASQNVFTYTARGKVQSDGMTADGKGSRWAYNEYHGTVAWNADGTITMTLVRDD